ncbi:hypothetical protein B0186_09525 [Canicola haemoglobinophilus]|uniref:Uncharacterized protein n=1 Tax=Canicola haemoglobinophilus TaxID=733 RepID=A0A1V4AZ92_9PAST|nr:hypothetical protein B0186_09525 [Canicola haemoglobinophilus]STO59225.1 Uncharacterised protein [Canicola haemoglobinophilus]
MKRLNQLHDVIDNFDENVVLLDNNSGENLKKIIQSINPNELFKKVFLEELDDNYIESEKLIKKYINHLQRDSEVLELAIKEIEEGFQRIEQQKQNAIQEVRSQNTEQAKYFIINKVTETIMDRREYLAQLALNNKYQFQEELNETVRNNLSCELKKYLKEMSDKAIYDFQSEIDSLNFLKEFDPNLVDDIVAKIQKDIEKSDTSIDLGEITSGIATLIGLLAGTVGAILKKVLDVLNAIPIIGSIWNSLFGSSNDERYKAEAARQEAIYKIEDIIAKDIVMKIKSSLEREIPKILTNALESMVATIANEFNQQLKSAQTAQKDALEVKNKDRASIEQNIQQLETVLSQLANLKQQYLK